MSTSRSSSEDTSDSDKKSTSSRKRGGDSKNRSKSRRSARDRKKVRASRSRIKQFLKLLVGKRDFVYQSYGPKRQDEPPLRPESGRLSVGSDAVKQLANLSNQGMNVGVVPNVMKGKRRRKEDAREIRYLFADIDKPGHTLKSLMKLAVPPTYVVETSPGRYHPYWRVEGCSVDEFSAVQRAIAVVLDSDQAVSDPSRCMRLPGTINFNHEPPFVARLVHPSKEAKRGQRIKLRKFVTKMKLGVEGVEASADVRPELGKKDNHSLSDAQIDALLQKFDPSSYDDWRMVGKALRSRYEDRAKWDAWSSRCPEKFDVERQKKEWRKFRPDGGTTIGTLVHRAEKHGGVGADLPQDDVDLAESLAIYESHRLRFGKHDQLWWHFDGGIWHSSKHAHGALKVARALVMRLIAESDGAPKAKHLLRGTTLRSAVLQAQWDPAFEIDESLFDADPYLLGVPNGVVELRTGEFREATPGDYLTRQTKVAFDPEAKCPLFIETLMQICKGRKDLYKFIVRYLGYTLTGLTTEEKVLLLIGRTRNGKGTLLNLLVAMLGSYAAPIPPSLLARANQGNPNASSSAIMRLRGARLILCTELTKGKFDEAFFKQLSGGDMLSARANFGDQVEFKPVGKLWMSANDDPDISAGAEAMWSRILALPFDVSFRGAAADTTLKERLAREAPGVLNLMIRAARHYLNDRSNPADGKMPSGLLSSKTVQDATSALFLRSDTVSDWTFNCCVEDEDAKLQSSVAYEHYSKYTRRSDKKPLGPTAFAKALHEKGHQKVKGRKHNSFLGIRLAEAKK